MSEYKIIYVKEFGNISLELNYYNEWYSCRLDNKVSHDYIEIFKIKDEHKAIYFYSKILNIYEELFSSEVKEND